MKITSYIELTPAQEKTLEAFESAIIRVELAAPVVVATFTTFQAQDVKVVIDVNGVIQSARVKERR